MLVSRTRMWLVVLGALTSFFCATFAKPALACSVSDVTRYLRQGAIVQLSDPGCYAIAAQISDGIVDKPDSERAAAALRQVGPSAENMKYLLDVASNDRRRASRLVALNAVAMASPDMLSNVDRDRLFDLAFHLTAPPQVAEAAIEAVENLYAAAPPPNLTAKFADALSNIILSPQHRRYRVLVQSYTAAIESVGSPNNNSSWRGLSGTLKSSITCILHSCDPSKCMLSANDCTTHKCSRPSTTCIPREEPYRQDYDLIPDLEAALVAVAPDEGIKLASEQLLQGKVRLDSGRLAATSLGPDERRSIAAAVLAYRGLSLATLSSLEPALLDPSNVTFGDGLASPKFENSVYANLPSGPESTFRHALYLELVAAFVANATSQFEARKTQASIFVDRLSQFTAHYSSQADADVLARVEQAGNNMRVAFNRIGLSSDARLSLDQAMIPISSAVTQERWRPAFAVLELAHTHPKALWAALPIAIWVLFVVAFPLWTLRAEEMLTQLAESHMKGVAEWVSFPFMLLLLRLPHVMDKWVNAFLREADDEAIVKASTGIIALPVQIRVRELEKWQSYDPLIPEAVRDLAKDGLNILISGEAGIGKSTLAGYIARLASERQGLHRWKRRAIPIVIDATIEDSAIENELILASIVQRLAAAVRNKLPVTGPFVTNLLASGRACLVVDGMSEMPKEVVGAMCRFLHAKKPKLLVITSRSETIAGSIPMIIARPQPIVEPERHSEISQPVTDRLRSFIANFKQSRGMSVNIDDGTIAAKLRIIADERVTPLLVRLYLEILTGGDATAENDSNVARVMLRYVRYVNEKVAKSSRLSNADVVEAAEGIGNVSCIDSGAYRATIVSKNSLEPYPKICPRLDYLIDSLCLLHWVGDAEDRVRFGIDSLGEYLAGFYIAKQPGNDGLTILRGLKSSDTEQTSALADFMLIVDECISVELVEKRLSRNDSVRLQQLRATVHQVLRRPLTHHAQRTVGSVSGDDANVERFEGGGLRRSRTAAEVSSRGEEQYE